MNLNVTLVKVIREVDNNNHPTEYFRVYKVETILVPAQIGTSIILQNGTRFFIERLDQDLQKCVVYVYDYVDFNHYKHWSKPEEFEKIKKKMVEDEGWSPINKHKILRGGI